MIMIATKLITTTITILITTIIIIVIVMKLVYAFASVYMLSIYPMRSHTNII
jgi:hypothetical protein